MSFQRPETEYSLEKCHLYVRGTSGAYYYFVPQWSKTSGNRNRKHKFMKKFLLGLIAIAAVLLPMTPSAQAHWGYYHHYWGPHYAYAHHRYWHRGYWYGGFWHAGYWGWSPAPVVVIVP